MSLLCKINRDSLYKQKLLGVLNKCLKYKVLKPSCLRAPTSVSQQVQWCEIWLKMHASGPLYLLKLEFVL